MGLNEIDIESIKNIDNEEDLELVFSSLVEIKNAEEALKEQLNVCKNMYSIGEKAILDYYNKELEKDPSFKLETMFGNVSNRKGKSWIYEDEKLLMEQIEKIEPSLLKISKSLDKNKLKKNVEVTDDGDVLMNDYVLEGVHVVEENKKSVKLKV